MRTCILTFRLWGLHKGNRIKTCVASQFTFNTTYGRNAVTKPCLSDSRYHIGLNSDVTLCAHCVSMTWPNNTSHFASAVGCPETVGTNVLCNTLLYFKSNVLCKLQTWVTYAFVLHKLKLPNIFQLLTVLVSQYYTRLNWMKSNFEQNNYFSLFIIEVSHSVWTLVQSRVTFDGYAPFKLWHKKLCALRDSLTIFTWTDQIISMLKYDQVLQPKTAANDPYENCLLETRNFQRTFAWLIQKIPGKYSCLTIINYCSRSVWWIWDDKQLTRCIAPSEL